MIKFEFTAGDRFDRPYSFPSRLAIVERIFYAFEIEEDAKTHLQRQLGFSLSSIDRLHRVLTKSHPDLRQAIDDERCPEAIAYRLSKLPFDYQAIVIESNVYQDCSVNVAVAQLRQANKNSPTIHSPSIEGRSSTAERMKLIRPVAEELIQLIPERATELGLMLSECAKGIFETPTF